MEKKVIAIFEDDEANRFIYKKSLKAWEDKLQVHYFDSLESSRQLIEHTHFDLILIDIHFHGLSFEGLKLLRKLRQINTEDWLAIGLMPFIQYGDVRRLQPLGFKICLEKPQWVFNMDLIFSLMKGNERDSSTSRLIPIL